MTSEAHGLKSLSIGSVPSCDCAVSEFLGSLRFLFVSLQAVKESMTSKYHQYIVTSLVSLCLRSLSDWSGSPGTEKIASESLTRRNESKVYGTEALFPTHEANEEKKQYSGKSQ